MAVPSSTPGDSPPRLISANAVVRMTGADRARIREWVSAGLLRAVQLPGCPVRYAEQDVLELIQNCGTRKVAAAQAVGD